MLSYSTARDIRDVSKSISPSPIFAQYDTIIFKIDPNFFARTTQAKVFMAQTLRETTSPLETQWFSRGLQLSLSN